ncbi:hypothetical protein CsSME_00043392 [Camellia sinensis var. sinensis]
MMRIMCSERGGRLFATDDRYCIDNGAMIAYTGLLAYANGMSTLLEESTFTQRFRTDEVLAIWREKMELSNGLMEKSTYMFQANDKQASCGQSMANLISQGNLLSLPICMEVPVYLTGRASAHEIWRASISTR